ncbi:MAG: RNA polymerase sigma-70 factor [Tannerellaceae bacterium]|nr:RNA polymerase sigma-70 factor [Tannerellaceae bacterium]
MWNKTCFTFLFNRYYSGLVVYARHLLGSDEFAEDIVHDVFASLWHNRSSLAINSSLKHYLFRAVKNRSLNYLNHLQVKSDYQKTILEKGDVAGALTWEYYVEVELASTIDKAINKLPPQCRKVFIMSRFEDKTTKEIAEALAISPRTVEKTY